MGDVIFIERDILLTHLQTVLNDDSITSIIFLANSEEGPFISASGDTEELLAMLRAAEWEIEKRIIEDMYIGADLED